MERFVSFIDKIDLKAIFNFILNPNFEGNLLYVKIVFIAISILFIIGIIFLSFISSWARYRYTEDIREFSTFKALDSKRFFKRWTRINKRLKSGRKAEYKLAVLESHTLLDGILDKAGYQGKTIEDRLKQIDASVLPNIEEAWELHRVRNQIVEDENYELSLDEAKKLTGVIKNVCNNLGVF